jgi:transposase
MKETKTRKRFSADFKDQAVSLVATGKPVSVVAQELGIGDGLLYRWVRNAKAAQIGSGGGSAGGDDPATDELRRLRRENAMLQEENNILKQAAVILGTKAQKKGKR